MKPNKKSTANTTKKEKLENKTAENKSQTTQSVEIPSVKEFTKDEIIEIYREEIKKKDKLISELETENKILLELTMKNAKKKLEELEHRIDESEKKEK